MCRATISSRRLSSWRRPFIVWRVVRSVVPLSVASPYCWLPRARQISSRFDCHWPSYVHSSHCTRKFVEQPLFHGQRCVPLWAYHGLHADGWIVGGCLVASNRRSRCPNASGTAGCLGSERLCRHSRTC